MVVKEKNYSERVDKILTDNKKYNEELQRRSATLELMASSHPFRVLRVEGDKNTQWDHGKPTYDKYTREIMIEEWPSIETLKVIKFDSAQPDLEKGDEWFRKYGTKAVFWGRILPGIRTFVSLGAGVAEMDLHKFMPDRNGST